MEHFEEKEVCKIEKTLIEITCDYCGRTLDKLLHWEGLALFSLKSRALEKISYFRTLSGHRDWGNNSIESREVKHICKDCIRQVSELGKIPIAPHLYFPQFLDDADPVERTRGIRFGLELLRLCEEVWVFGDVISEGMGLEIEYANSQGKVVKYIGTGCNL